MALPERAWEWLNNRLVPGWQGRTVCGDTLGSGGNLRADYRPWGLTLPASLNEVNPSINYIDQLRLAPHIPS